MSGPFWINCISAGSLLLFTSSLLAPRLYVILEVGLYFPDGAWLPETTSFDGPLVPPKMNRCYGSLLARVGQKPSSHIAVADGYLAPR